MEGGPPEFPPGFTCPTVLWYLPQVRYISLTGLSPSMIGHSMPFSYARIVNLLPFEERQARNPMMHAPWFGLFPVRSPLLRVSRLIYLPLGTEMFHFPRLPSHSYITDCSAPSLHDSAVFTTEGFPIRTSTDQRLLAPPRGLSQLATSFIDF